MTTFSTDEFRKACGVWASGVSIVTTRDAEGRPAWLRATGPGAVDQETADSYVARQVQRDPDLWVVEFDAPDLQPPFEARIV